MKDEKNKVTQFIEEDMIQANPVIPVRLLDKVKNKFKLKKFNGQVSTQSLYDRDVTTSSVAHIFLGGISKAGYTKEQPVGMHTITPGSDLEQVEADKEPDYKSDKTRAVRPLTEQDDNYAPPGKNGVYKAKIWLRETKYNNWKQKESTMFPTDWSQEQVIDVIRRSYDVAKKVGSSNGTETWEGRDPITKSMIVMKCQPNTGEVITAYPKYEKE
ncbi:EndoU domain-containing protein [Bacillus toyonensis]|uniref:EndoU domain-containing protein n=1 Tax=Bacillus toyonensis TaxID=155322 RepID=UPI003CF3DAC1